MTATKKSFNLDEFLYNYEPKSLQTYLKPYLQTTKLENYVLLEDLDLIAGTRVYIRYVNIETAFDDKQSNLTDKRSNLTDKRSNLTDKRSNLTDKRSNLTDKNKIDISKIKSGGFLIGGGYYYRGKLVQCRKTEQWTHLVLKFDPSFFNANGGAKIPAKIFSLSLNKNYVFYYKNQDMRSLIEQMRIELLDF
jgi:hypothetical protein